MLIVTIDPRYLSVHVTCQLSFIIIYWVVVFIVVVLCFGMCYSVFGRMQVGGVGVWEGLVVIVCAGSQFRPGPIAFQTI